MHNAFLRYAKEHYLWVMTAVALLLLAVLAMNSPLRDWLDAETSVDTPLAQYYQELRADEANISGSWLRTLNPLVKDVQGSLVWSSSAQSGVMRFSRLPDPANGFRYRLWAYDSQSADNAPVSLAMLEKGAGRQARYVPLVTETALKSPYKFELVLEPESNQDDSRVLMMVQP